MKNKLKQFFGAFGIDMNHFSLERTQSGSEELYYLESKRGFTAASRYPLVYFTKEDYGVASAEQLMRVELPNKKYFVLIDLVNQAYAVTSKSKYQVVWHFFEGDELSDPAALVKHIKQVV